MGAGVYERFSTGALIAAIYTVLCIALQPISWAMAGCEALTVLPIVYKEAIPGIFIGVLLANILADSVWLILFSAALQAWQQLI